MSEETKDYIETDNDTAAEDQSDKSTYPYDPAYSDIEILDMPYTVFEYLRQLDKGKIIIQPDFQRKQVWNNKQKSRFIESVMLNYPLPPIYLNETKDGKFIVIDGLQRTSTINQFYKNNLILGELEALPQYNDKNFKQIPENVQSKFEDKKLTIFILKPSTPMPVIYDLFSRINTGGTQLNRQEVRNGIFIGKSTKLLKYLSEQDYFKKAIDNGVRDNRMKDREVVLRYLAFRWFDYNKEYSGDMSNYVESAMKKINNFEDEMIHEIKEDFQWTMETCFSIWGKKCFRIPTKHTRGSINIAILESVANFISKQNDKFIKTNKKTIEHNYNNLINNATYLDAVTKSTGTKSKVIDRFKIATKILNQGTK